MKDLDLLLKAKREEPTTVSIEAIDSWLNSGILLIGLFATLKRLFTQKMWLMFTSISSISVVIMMAIAQFSSAPSVAPIKSKPLQNKVSNNHLLPEAPVQTQIMSSPHLQQVRELAMTPIRTLATNALPSTTAFKLIEPSPNAAPQTMVNNDTTQFFDRIDVNGSISFTLVNGPTCSVSNLLKDGMEAASFNYTIKNGILFLEGVPENDATVLVITVPDLRKIKINGFCNIVTPQPFNATTLELEVNGFVKLDLDLNVKDLELDLNGENSGKIRINSDNLELEINGVNDLEVVFMVKQSWIDINGLGKLKFSGSTRSAIMAINGENKFDGEAFSSEELYLKVSGVNQKIETTVYEKLDVEISGSNNVIIQGSPKEVKQIVAPGAKLRLK
jgi:hypothetical protein